MYLYLNWSLVSVWNAKYCSYFCFLTILFFSSRFTATKPRHALVVFLWCSRALQILLLAFAQFASWTLCYRRPFLCNNNLCLLRHRTRRLDLQSSLSVLGTVQQQIGLSKVFQDTETSHNQKRGLQRSRNLEIIRLSSMSNIELSWSRSSSEIALGLALLIYASWPANKTLSSSCMCTWLSADLQLGPS